MQKIQPVKSFIAFFKGYVHLCKKIFAAKCTFTFSNVGTDTGTASEQLLGENIFPLFAGQMLIQTNNADSKTAAFAVDTLRIIPNSSLLTPNS